jgi:energy-coupling factor transporter ATP-binding protein EcfA2
MRLTKVRVTKLFGLFDHEIPLNREERITIIHGPNGFGKTIVLRMIAALFSRQYEFFREVPFETFAAEFDGGQILRVTRVEKVSTRDKKTRLSIVKIGHSSLNASEPEQWWPVPFGGPFSMDESEPEWLAEVLAYVPSGQLVLTQRLGIEKPAAEDEDADEDSRSTPETRVEAYSEEIAVQIRQTLAEYATRSQELDRTFPTRLLSQVEPESLTAEELRKRLSDLEQKRILLISLGFLDPEQELNPAPIKALEAKRDVLSVYVADMEQKLSMIRLFVRIVNERFLFKRLEIHRDRGFVFTSATGAQIEPSRLSSGEQHELILFYALLFKLKKNALILIDEPEISLHVAWQEKFLEDLGEVVKLSEIDVVIATHSPEIIGEHWDLTVELKGPSEVHKS